MIDRQAEGWHGRDLHDQSARREGWRGGQRPDQVGPCVTW